MFVKIAGWRRVGIKRLMKSQDKHARSAASADRRERRVRVMLGAFAGVFLVIFGGVVAYAGSRTLLYRSTAAVQVLYNVKDPVSATGAPVVRPEPPDEINFAANVRMLESEETVKAAAARLKPEEKERLVKPYGGGWLKGPVRTEMEVLEQGRTFLVMPEILTLRVSFAHPNAEMAAAGANALAAAFAAECQQANEDYAQKHIAGVAARVEELRAKEVETEAKMNVLVAKFGATALAMNDETLALDLKSEEMAIMEKADARDAAAQRWAQVQQQEAANKPVRDLPFIANQSRVAPLITAYNGTQEGPAKAMVEKMLEEATASAVETVRTDAEAAQKSYEQAVAQRDATGQRIEDLAKARKDYNTLDNDFKTEKSDYENAANAAADEQEKFNLSELNFRVTQLGVPAAEPDGMAFSRWVEIGLVAGVLGGAGGAWVARAVLQVRRERRLSVTW